MADITMCMSNAVCRLRDTCYRSPYSGTLPGERRQSWTYYRHDLGEQCPGFWPIKDREPQPTPSQVPAMSDLHKLLERVKAASGPDRELDADLAEETGIRVERERWSRYTQEWAPIIYDWMGCAKHPLPSFTASIDAALALTERMLPGVNALGFDTGPDGIVAYVSLNYVEKRKDAWHFEGEAATPALSFLAALLTALIAQEPRDE